MPPPASDTPGEGRRPAAVWEERYRQRDTPWDRGAPSPIVLRLVSEQVTPPARILVPGCGRGHEVLALSRLGHRLTALDIAPTALRELAGRLDGTSEAVEIVEGNLLETPVGWNERFDLIAEHTCFCTFPPEEVGDYARAAATLLRPGGELVGAFLHFEGGGPPYGTDPARLRAAFEADFEIVRIAPAPERFEPADRPQLEAVFRRRERTPA